MSETPAHPSMNFSEALAALFDGKRVGAYFLPPNIFIEQQIPDGGSMNTEPYLKMVEINDTDANGNEIVTPVIEKCEPWEPGRRSIFSKDWFISPFDGKEIAIKVLI